MDQKICGVNAVILHTIFFFLVVTPNVFHLSPSFFEVVLFWLFIFLVIYLPGIACASAFKFSLTFKELVGVAIAVGLVTVSLLYFIVIVFDFQDYILFILLLTIFLSLFIVGKNKNYWLRQTQLCKFKKDHIFLYFIIFVALFNLMKVFGEIESGDKRIGSAVASDSAASDKTGDWTNDGASLAFDTDHYELTTTGTGYGSRIASLSVTAGKLYKISAQLKDGTAAPTTFKFRFYDGGTPESRDSADIDTTGSYVTYSATFRCLKTTSSGYMGMYVGTSMGGSNIEFKDVNMYEIEEPVDGGIYSLSHEVHSVSYNQSAKAIRGGIPFVTYNRPIMGGLNTGNFDTESFLDIVNYPLGVSLTNSLLAIGSRGNYLYANVEFRLLICLISVLLAYTLGKILFNRLGGYIFALMIGWDPRIIQGINQELGATCGDWRFSWLIANSYGLSLTLLLTVLLVLYFRKNENHPPLLLLMGLTLFSLGIIRPMIALIVFPAFGFLTICHLYREKKLDFVMPLGFAFLGGLFFMNSWKPLRIFDYHPHGDFFVYFSPLAMFGSFDQGCYFGNSLGQITPTNVFILIVLLFVHHSDFATVGLIWPFQKHKKWENFKYNHIFLWSIIFLSQLSGWLIILPTGGSTASFWFLSTALISCYGASILSKKKPVGYAFIGIVFILWFFFPRILNLFPPPEPNSSHLTMHGNETAIPNYYKYYESFRFLNQHTEEDSVIMIDPPEQFPLTKYPIHILENLISGRNCISTTINSENIIAYQPDYVASFQPLSDGKYQLTANYNEFFWLYKLKKTSKHFLIND